MLRTAQTNVRNGALMTLVLSGPLGDHLGDIMQVTFIGGPRQGVELRRPDATPQGIDDQVWAEGYRRESTSGADGKVADLVYKFRLNDFDQASRQR